MIPLIQTKFSDVAAGIHGNCFGTCVASLLHLPPTTIPAFEDMGDGTWFGAFWDLLKANGCRYRGTRYLRQRILEGDASWPDEEDIGPGIDGYFIVGGGSPRGVTRGHAVIYRAGSLVMDPHPSGEGLTDLGEIYMIERGEK